MFERVMTGILAVCAVAVTLMVARREFRTPDDPSKPKPPVFVKDWGKYATGSMHFGAAGGKVTVVEFSDFQCPYCKRFHSDLARLQAAHPSELQVYYRNFPIQAIHPYAKPAALAAECAADQGRFQQFHDYLFEHQDSLRVLDLVAVATAVQVADTTGFRHCLASAPIAKRVEVDSIAAEEFKLTGTPTVMVNGWRFSGTPTFEQLETMIEKLNNGKK
ncbi:MAG: DsbA family protein [Gemmatimonadales bacterium]